MVGYPARHRALFLLACTIALASWGQARGQAKGGAAAKEHDDKKVEVTHLSGEDVEKVRLINEHLSTKWKENKITPSVKASEYEFIRRASLDIIGRVAKPQEIEKFLKDPESSRRSLLIERLLKSDEYPKNQANLWTVWLMTRTGSNETGGSIYHDQMRKWLEDQFKKEGMSFKEMVRELLTATGKTNENGAVNYILSHLGETVPKDKQQGEDGEGKFTMVPVTSRTTKLFLGVQIQCTQCHTHPFNEEWNVRTISGASMRFFRASRPQGSGSHG